MWNNTLCDVHRRASTISCRWRREKKKSEKEKRKSPFFLLLRGILRGESRRIFGPISYGSGEKHVWKNAHKYIIRLYQKWYVWGIGEKQGKMILQKYEKISTPRIWLHISAPKNGSWPDICLVWPFSRPFRHTKKNPLLMDWSINGSLLIIHLYISFPKIYNF